MNRAPAVTLAMAAFMLLLPLPLFGQPEQDRPDRPPSVTACGPVGCAPSLPPPGPHAPPVPRTPIETQRQLHQRLTELQRQSSRLVELAKELNSSTEQPIRDRDFAHKARQIEKLAKSVSERLVPTRDSSEASGWRRKNTSAQLASMAARTEQLLRASMALKQSIDANTDGHIDVQAVKMAHEIVALAKTIRKAPARGAIDSGR